MPVLADTKVLPEALDRTYERIRKVLDAPEATRARTRRRSR
jgi:hypothetical protein